MQLSSAQTATFKAWLLANAPAQTFSDQQAAALANTLVSPSYFVWQTASTATKGALDAAITKANYTPTDAPPASPSTDMTYQNRAILCQLKQGNAQWLTAGDPGSGIDCRVSGIRQNFKDCLLAIPSGVSGANQDAGWGTAGSPGTVRTAMMRPATNFEKLYVSAAAGPGNDGVVGNRGTVTNPDLLGLDSAGQTIEGQVTATQVAETRASQ